MELFAVVAAVVSVLDGHLVGINRYLALLIVDGDLDPVRVRGRPVRALPQGGLQRQVIEEPALLLPRVLRILVRKNKSDRF